MRNMLVGFTEPMAVVIWVLLALVTAYLFFKEKIIAYRIMAILSMIVLLMVVIGAILKPVLWLAIVAGILMGILVIITIMCWRDEDLPGMEPEQE